MRKSIAVFVLASVALFATASVPAEGKTKKIKVESVSVAKYKDGAKAAVSLSYDDGLIDHYNLVAPHLDAAGLKGSFWIITSWIEKNPGAVTWAQLREMAANGHEIANHTHTHPHLGKLSDEEVLYEIRHADDLIEQNVGVRPKTITFPFNQFDARIVKFARDGRVGMRQSQTQQGQGRAFKGKGTCYSTLPDMKSWLEGIVSNGGFGITMTHGILDGYDIWEDPQVYWDFLAYCGTRKNDVWFGTLSDICSYIAERSACSIRWSVKGNKLKVVPAMKGDGNVTIFSDGSCTFGAADTTIDPYAKSPEGHKVMSRSAALDKDLYTMDLSLEIVIDGKRHYIPFNPFSGPFTLDLLSL